MVAHPNPALVRARAAVRRVPMSPWRFAQRVAAGVIEHQCMGSSAQIAYYLLFAAFPFLLSFASLLAFLPIPHLIDWLLGSLGAVVPAEAVDLLRDSVERVVTRPHSGLFSASIVVALWAGANAVEAIMQGLNRVQGLWEDRPFWKTRSIALLLAVGVSFFAMLGLVVLWFGSSVSRWWDVRGGLGPLPVDVWRFIRWPLVLVSLIGAIDQLYFVGPAARPRWRWITPGAVVAVLGWVAASLGFSAYVTHFGSYNVMYGSIGAVIILLTWMYLTSFFILLGAEINMVAGENWER